MNDAVAHWLTAFRSNPVSTLHDLIMGRAVVPVWSQATLREVFLEILADQDALLDQALAGWVAEYLGKPTPPRTPQAVWSSHLQDVFQGAAELPLPEFERLLRQRLDELGAWLKPLRLAENCDPLIAAYRALAWGHTNHDLEQQLWRPLALRQIQADPSYTNIGLLGLIRARDAQGRLPAKPTDLLLDTLLDLADSGMVRQEWEPTTRSVMAGYMLSDATWARLFEARLNEPNSLVNAGSWVTQLFGQAVGVGIDSKVQRHEKMEPKVQSRVKFVGGKIIGGQGQKWVVVQTDKVVSLRLPRPVDDAVRLVEDFMVRELRAESRRFIRKTSAVHPQHSELKGHVDFAIEWPVKTLDITIHFQSLEPPDVSISQTPGTASPNDEERTPTSATPQPGSAPKD